jgi:hypothetical protein
MEVNQEAGLILALKFLHLAEGSTQNTSVTEAMRFAGYSEEVINNPTRKEEAKVCTAFNKKKKKQPYKIKLPVKEVPLTTSLLSVFYQKSSLLHQMIQQQR